MSESRAVFQRSPPIPPSKPLPPRPRLPANYKAILKLSEELHAELGIKGPSERLSKGQLEKVYLKAAAATGLRTQLLKYIASVEAAGVQTADSGAAHGLMQVERSAHPTAYVGAINVGNDTITNVLYGALLRARVDKRLDEAFLAEGLAPPSNRHVRELLGDFAYNRGPMLLEFLPKYAKQQGVNINAIVEYIAGRGGRYELSNRWGSNRIRIFPIPGSPVSPTGEGSVLQLALAEVNRRSPITLSRNFADRTGNGGRPDHLDVWVVRGEHYRNFMARDV